MRVLHIIGGISHETGGPSRSCQGLVAAECRAGIDAWLWPINGGMPWVDGVRCFECRTIGDLDKTLRTFDLVHVHGIWGWNVHKAVVACRRVGVHYLLAPRGMMAPWALRYKWLKKKIARIAYQDRDLRLAAALHATAESEAEHLRRLGFENNIIISPNGIIVPESLPPHAPSIAGKMRSMLFIGRMHSVKGVLELVESWARVKPEGWRCELVYTMRIEEERAYERKVKQRIHELGLDDQFVVTGALDESKKWEAYARADLFVLPSHTENFGIVVAEALWAGVPVITTKGTPWKELEERKCGWWIDLPEVEAKGEGEQWNALDNALWEACGAAGVRVLPEMGKRGRALVAERYTWAAVCGKIVRGYKEILNERFE